MRTWLLHRGRSIAGLELADLPPPPLAEGEVRIRVHAVSLNWRDLFIARADSRGPALVPCSDGAGEIAEVGPGVSGWAVGDRVTAAFYPDWTEGPPSDASVSWSLGGGRIGWLSKEVVMPAQALVRVPAAFTWAEAATFACAGVTAWNALFESARPTPGATVLVQGTGGVSLWALQLARAAGMRVIATSSSEDKLKVARELGAHETVNYASDPQWPASVLRWTGGEGVDVTIDVGGRDSLAASMQCTRMGGTVAMVGGLTGFDVHLEPFALIDRSIRLVGVLVGSRAMTARLVKYARTTGIRPRIDRVFPFTRARDAYEYLAAGRHVGKVVIAVSEAAQP